VKEAQDLLNKIRLFADYQQKSIAFKLRNSNTNLCFILNISSFLFLIPLIKGFVLC